jgi:hypothetical protein
MIDLEKINEQIAALNRVGRGDQVLREMRALDAARRMNVKIRGTGRAPSIRALRGGLSTLQHGQTFFRGAHAIRF